MVNILITGGAGFIGSALSESLNSRGHDVTILDNLSPQIHGADPSTSPSYQRVLACADVRVGDVTSRSDLLSALYGQKVVVHLAAETGTGQSMYQISRYAEVNVGGTANLVDLIANAPGLEVQKVVVASSRSIYGEGRYRCGPSEYVYPLARLETDLIAGRYEPTYPGCDHLDVVATDEESRIHPSSVYGITKYAQEMLVMTSCPTVGVSPVALRYQNVYGPGQSLSNPYTGILSIFSSIIRSGGELNIFEDGLESRDFVYIDDVVDATLRAVLDEHANGLVFNVGSGVATTVLRVVDELQRAFEREVAVQISGNFRLGDIRHNYADIARISHSLDYRPNTAFDDGVRRFAAWVNGQDKLSDDYQSSLEEMRRRNMLK